MNLRPVSMRDHQFILECYQDWPITNDGPATPDTVTRWIRYWVYRANEDCLIGEENGSVGAVVYRKNLFAVYVKNIVVHPDHRRKGHANAIMKALRDKLVKEGAAVAEFDALPGPISAQVRRGKFQFVGNTEGQTGPLVKGRLTMDMEI